MYELCSTSFSVDLKFRKHSGGNVQGHAPCLCFLWCNSADGGPLRRNIGLEWMTWMGWAYLRLLPPLPKNKGDL